MANTILIIDDEEEVRHLMTLFFSGKGLQVIVAESVEAARDHIPECNLVLSDIRIGTGNGIEFLEEIRGQGINKPFLFMSGIQISAENEKAKELTGYPVLDKSDIIKVGFEIVKRILAE